MTDTTPTTDVINFDDLNRKQVEAWLRGRNAYAGHSKTPLPQLRKVAATIQAVDAEDPNGTANHDLPTIDEAHPAPSGHGNDGDVVVEMEVEDDTTTEPPMTCTEFVTGGDPADSCARCGERVDVHDAPTPVASTDRLERLELAKAEHAALKAWKQGGEQGDRPVTVNLDAMNADHAAGVRTTRKRTSSTSANPRREKAAGIRFHRRGKAMPDAQNKLSSVAFQATKGLAADGTGRWTTAELIAWLAEQGTTNPEATAWEHTLPNGVVIAATVPPAR